MKITSEAISAWPSPTYCRALFVELAEVLEAARRRLDRRPRRLAAGIRRQRRQATVHRARVLGRLRCIQ